MFEKEVPKPLTVTDEQREVWGQGADWLERNVESPDEAKAVSGALSDSIGAPAYPEEDYAKVIDRLRGELVKERKREREQNEDLWKIAGEKVKGSGITIGGFSFSVWVWVLILIGILAMGGGPLLVHAFLRVRRGFIQTIETIEDMKKRDHEFAAEFEDRAGRKMDRKDKKVVRNLKRNIR